MISSFTLPFTLNSCTTDHQQNEGVGLGDARKSLGVSVFICPIAAQNIKYNDQVCLKNAKSLALTITRKKAHTDALKTHNSSHVVVCGVFGNLVVGPFLALLLVVAAYCCATCEGLQQRSMKRKLLGNDTCVHVGSQNTRSLQEHKERSLHLSPVTFGKKKNRYRELETCQIKREHSPN